MNKKSQTEILGLVIIVIILSIGILFVITIMSKGSDSNARQEYQNIEIAQNFMSALSDVNLEECGNIRLSKLITYCAEGSSVQMCGDTSNYEYAEKVITNITRDTLDEWEKRYILTYIDKFDNREIIRIETGDCSPDDPQQKPGETIIATSSYTPIEGKLIICSD